MKIKTSIKRGLILGMIVASLLLSLDPACAGHWVISYRCEGNGQVIMNDGSKVAMPATIVEPITGMAPVFFAVDHVEGGDYSFDGSGSITPIVTWEWDHYFDMSVPPSELWYQADSSMYIGATAASATFYHSMGTPPTGELVPERGMPGEWVYGHLPVRRVDNSKREKSLTLDTTFSFSAKANAQQDLLTGLEAWFGIKLEKFVLHVSVPGETLRLKDDTRSKEIEAEAVKTYSLGINPVDPPTFFWNGEAKYKAEFSASYDTFLGSKTYKWTAYPWPGNPHKPTPLTDEENVTPSTQAKHFYHDFGQKPAAGTTHIGDSLTTVEVVGSNPQGPVLTANAKISWYELPNTPYHAQTQWEVIDLDTGSVTALSDELTVLPQEASDDALIARIKGANDGFFNAFTTIMNTGTAVGMTAIEVFLPDPVDAATGGASKIYKTAKAAKVISRVGAALDEIGDLLHGAVKAKRAAGAKGQNILLRATSNVDEGGRLGKLPPNSTRDTTPDPDSGKPFQRFIGPFCFTAGTPIVLEDGRLKPVEEVKVGDLVLSKDERTGEVAAKRVSATTQRQAPSTLVLAFGNGEKVETTAEHPFYREGDGFTHAALLAIGNSIVTRAGPSLAITSIEKKNSPTIVYNFTVEAFHTYFVGRAALWVHNTNCTVYGKALERANNVLKDTPMGQAIPRKAGAIEIPGHPPITGVSSRGQDWTIHEDLAKLYDNPDIVPNPSRYHKNCAEAHVLTQIFNMGLGSMNKDGMKGAKSITVNVSYNTANHGTKVPACDSCRDVLSYLGIIDTFYD